MELTKEELKTLFDTARNNAREAINKLDEGLDNVSFGDMEIYATRLLTWLHICQFAKGMYEMKPSDYRTIF
jgi:hypothetical protein